MYCTTKLLAIGTLFVLGACAGLGLRSDAQSSFEAGIALFNQSQYERAIPHFQKATELDPNFARAYLYLGRSYLNLSRWSEAVSPLRTAWRLSPQETRKEATDLLIDALFGAATATFKKGDIRGSINFLKEVFTLEPQAVSVKKQVVETMLGFGSTLLSQAKVADAITAYTEATQLAPENLHAYLGLAQAFLQHGEFSKALAAVGDALRIAPTSVDALSLLRQLQVR